MNIKKDLHCKSFLLPQPKHAQQYPVNQRLVRQVNSQRMPPHPFQHGRFLRKQPIQRSLLFHKPMEEIPRQKQKQPWEQRKVVCRIKIRSGKSQIRCQQIPVQPLRHTAKPQALKPQISVIDIPEQQKQRHPSQASQPGIPPMAPPAPAVFPAVSLTAYKNQAASARRTKSVLRA